MKSKFLGYTKDIVVIDNIVSIDKADAWEKHVTNNNFAWYLLRDIDPSKISDKSNHRTTYDNNTINTNQFTHDLRLLLGVYQFRKLADRDILRQI